MFRFTSLLHYPD